MLLEIIYSNLLGLSVDTSKDYLAQLEKIQTLSGHQTLIITEPIQPNLREKQTQLIKGELNQSRYRLVADIDYERRRGIDNNRYDDRYDDRYDARYDRRRVEAIRNQIEAIDDRIEELEEEKDRLEDLERRYRRRYR